MSDTDWRDLYRTRLEDDHRLARDWVGAHPAPLRAWELDAEDWGAAAAIAAALEARHAGLWADPPAADAPMRVYAALERDGRYLLLRAEVPPERPELPSQTPWFAGLDRLERHARDLLGLCFINHPDARRWTRHRAWSASEFPLRAEFPLAGTVGGRVRADADYPFGALHGGGVYEIPVGPVHAGIIEPGHFRFQAAGEDVLRLEERLGYVHRGIEKLAVGRDAAGLARLAGRVSGDSTVAHAWAAVQAFERAAAARPPARALWLRALLCERERVANHLGDIGAICNDVGFAFAWMQCARLREDWLRVQRDLFGHRLLMDQVIPGGVATDVQDADRMRLRAAHAALRRAIRPLFAIIDDHPSLTDRLIGTGYLAPAAARALGCTGYLGKASGQAFDARRDAAYPPYDGLAVSVPVETSGDVAARVRVRMAEIQLSLDLMDLLLDGLPAGAPAAPLPVPPADAIGLGLIEGWRGEVLAFVRLDASGRIARYFPRDPSWFAWPALERLILGNIVPDFPVCNKSVNGSYAGVDL